MKTFLIKHIRFNNQKSNNYFLLEINLPVVFSHFLHQVHENPQAFLHVKIGFTQNYV